MKYKNSKKTPQTNSFKGEMVPEKDRMDYDTTGEYLKKNPYKIPPNKLTTKEG